MALADVWMTTTSPTGLPISLALTVVAGSGAELLPITLLAPVTGTLVALPSFSTRVVASLCTGVVAFGFIVGISGALRSFKGGFGPSLLVIVLLVGVGDSASGRLDALIEGDL